MTFCWVPAGEFEMGGEVGGPAPPQVATIFPPFAKPRNIGRQCPSIAAPPASAPAT
jgi:hypothetical protein